MKNLNIIAAAIISVVMLATSAFAQDLNKGWDAYEAGDYATALQEFRPLAGQGNAYAQTNLGFMYESGQGVPQDYAEAVKWYRMAAEQGNALGQTNLGVMHEKGKGVPKGYAEAVEWYRLAAEQGHASAQTNLGVMYDKGQGVLQDNVLAHMWYNLGAANGSKNGPKNRDSIAEEMTREDISKAQSMASECMSSDYKNCGY